MNTYDRTRSILRKAGLTQRPQCHVKIAQPEEELLSRLLLRFGDAVELAATDRKPHHLCGYLYELAGQYHRFFEACPVLQLPALRDSRLTLVGLTGDVLKEGLGLLGISTLEEM